MKKVINKRNISLAGEILSADDDTEVEKMIKLILKSKDQNNFIDNVNGVEVWDKVQYEFSVKDFLNYINLK